MKKRALILAATLILLLGVLTIGASAATEVASGTCGTDGDNLTWVLNNDGQLTISGTGTMADYGYDGSNAPWYGCRSKIKTVTIESGVASIGEGAFRYCRNLASITIPDSVTSINSYSFYNCASLTTITIPNGVTTISGPVFYDCTSLKTAGPIGGNYNIQFGWTDAIPAKAFYGCTGLTSIVIPDSVTSIGSSAFRDCAGLTSITIPDNVTFIRGSTFYRCTSLTSIVIPDSVTSIGTFAFSGCTGLTSITIPDSVTSIDSNAFYGCTGLKTAGPIGGNYSIQLGWTDAIPAKAFYGCTDLTSIVIPDNVTSIGSTAFSGCTGLTSITIPDSVTSIDSNAFYGCTGLKTAGPIGGNYSIQLGWTDAIPAKAFYDCADLTSIIIPDSVTSISDYAFYGCTGLTLVVIPDGVTSISSSSFSGCTGLKTAGPIGGNYSIQFGWTDAIPAQAFSNCTGLTSIVIPDSVTSIGGYAFRKCTGLTSITIPDNVTSISGSAFYGCTGLTSIVIPDSVTSIGWYAFSGCTSLTSIVIPANVTSIGDHAFYNCAGLKTAGPIGGNYSIQFGWTDAIPAQAFYGCTDLTSIVIPDNVISIGINTFRGCTSLTSITIPDSVTAIGSNAFYDCTGLKTAGPIGGDYSIQLGWTDAIPAQAFSGCTDLTLVVIPSNVTSIGICAFSSCTGLTSITIPDSVTSVGVHAFNRCTNLKTAGPIGGNYNIQFGWTDAIPANAFYGCTDLASIVIPDGVTSISNSAFNNCTSLTSIVIPNSVTNIDNHAFLGCTGLTSVTIPDNVTTIGVAAFFRCANLTSVAIPSSVTSIGRHAFFECTSLSSVTFSGNIKSIAAKAFDGCTSLETVTFAGTVGTIGESAFRNCALTSLILPEGETVTEAHAFRYCSNLKLAYLPASTKSIGNYAFSDTALTDIYYGGSVEQWETLLATGSSQFPEDVTVHYNSDGTVYDLTTPNIKVTNRASDGKPYISWDTVNGAGGYEVWYCGTKAGTYKLLYTAKADKLSVTHTGAAVGNDYFYKVRATSDDVQSEFSSIKGVWVDLKRPTIKVTNNTSSGKPVISWNKVSYATGYKVYCATGSSTGTYKLIYSTTNPDKLSVTHIGAEAGEAYFYKVVAVHKNSKCNSAYSTAKGVYCDLARPTLTVTLNSNGKPYLSWTNSAGADSYKVYRSYDGNSWTLMYTVKSNDHDVNHTGAKADTTYYYRVIAICNTTSKANSSYSAVKMITTE